MGYPAQRFIPGKFLGLVDSMTDLPVTPITSDTVISADHDPVDTVEASIIAKEPVLASFLAAAVAGSAGIWAHTHFGTDQNTVTQWVEPIVTGSILTGLGIITRELVVPLATFSKKVEAEVNRRVNAALGNKPAG